MMIIMLVVRCSEMQNATRMSRSVSLTNDVREVTACLINKSDAYLFSPSLAVRALMGHEVFSYALISLFPARFLGQC